MNNDDAEYKAFVANKKVEFECWIRNFVYGLEKLDDIEFAFLQETIKIVLDQQRRPPKMLKEQAALFKRLNSQSMPVVTTRGGSLKWKAPKGNLRVVPTPKPPRAALQEAEHVAL